MVEVGDVIESCHGIGEVLSMRSPKYFVVKYADGRQLLTSTDDLIETTAQMSEPLPEPDPEE